MILYIIFYFMSIVFQKCRGSITKLNGALINNLHLHKNTKLISISPGGFKGIYMLGVTNYIKEHYPLQNFVFSGASAGAWLSFIMTYKGDNKELVDKIGILSSEKHKNNVVKIEKHLQEQILKHYTKDDFDLERVFIGVTRFERLTFHTDIYSHFKELQDVIECCIASSHIPLVTGGFANKYDNKYTFDGGLIVNPYINIQPILHISPSIWSSNKKKETPYSLYRNLQLLYDSSALLYGKHLDLQKMYQTGYEDSAKNKEHLDRVFFP